jgi:hypothetical protein
MDSDLVDEARAQVGVAPKAPKLRDVIPIDKRAVMVAKAGAQDVIPFGGRSESPTRGRTGLVLPEPIIGTGDCRTALSHGHLSMAFQWSNRASATNPKRWTGETMGAL